MSRVLADILGANHFAFRQKLQQLERKAGEPHADIRLQTELQREVRAKIAQLGLEPSETTGHELFRALEERLKSDEDSVRQALKLDDASTSTDLLVSVQRFLSEESSGYTVFAVKPTVMRAALKKLKPKATMKALGYRSMESMFKHEPIAQLLAATQMIEDATWQKARLDAYAKLRSSDFELRKVSYIVPTSKRWPDVAKTYTARYKHNMLVVPELGGVVILPLHTELPGLAIVTIMLGLQALADIRSRSALLKLQQVRPDFGAIFRAAIEQEPMTEVEFGGNKLSWRSIHWFYGSTHAPYHPELFEPHLQSEDFRTHEAHDSLARLHEALAFWRGGHMLAMLDGRETVSLNILDVALGVCNGVSYANRFVHNMREALSRELLARYLRHGNLQQSLEDTLGRQLAPEIAFD